MVGSSSTTCPGEHRPRPDRPTGRCPRRVQVPRRRRLGRRRRAPRAVARGRRRRLRQPQDRSARPRRGRRARREPSNRCRPSPVGQSVVVLWAPFEPDTVQDRRVIWTRGDCLADLLAGQTPSRLNPRDIAHIAEQVRAATRIPRSKQDPIRATRSRAEPAAAPLFNPPSQVGRRPEKASPARTAFLEHALPAAASTHRRSSQAQPGFSGRASESKRGPGRWRSHLDRR